MNKQIQTIALVLILFFSSATAWAQDGEKPAPEKKKIKTMIDYKDELGLSEDQVKEVATALVSFQNTVKKLRADLAQHEQDYKKLVAEEAPLADIKAKLRLIADTRFALRYADVLTSRRVSEALTDAQMAKWREIQTKVRTDR